MPCSFASSSLSFINYCCSFILFIFSIALTLIFIFFPCWLSDSLEFNFQKGNLVGLVFPVPSTVHPAHCTRLRNLWWINVSATASIGENFLLFSACWTPSYSSFKTHLTPLLGSCGFLRPHTTFYTAWYFWMFTCLFKLLHLEYLQGISISPTLRCLAFCLAHSRYFDYVWTYKWIHSWMNGGC